MELSDLFSGLLNDRNELILIFILSEDLESWCCNAVLLLSKVAFGELKLLLLSSIN